jgi:hypothetical protein
MLLCSDCHLPTPLDDAVTVFRDGSCICLTGNRRGATSEPGVPAVLRQAISALLADTA